MKPLDISHRKPTAGKSVPAHVLLLAAALILTFIAYCGTVSFHFAYDDRAQILSNPIIHSWGFTPRYFTEHVWQSIDPDEPGNYYRPIFLVWLRMNDMLFGSRPWGWHLTSLMAHLGVTLLVYFLAVRLLEDRLAAAFAAVIFGVHPIHIEAVAWVSGVTDPLLALFFIGSFLCYLRQKEGASARWKWMATSLGLFAGALLSKETGVVFPGVIIAYEWITYRNSGTENPRTGLLSRAAKSIRGAVPYLILVPVYLVARIHAVRGLGHAITPIPLKTIALTWPSLLWFYLGKLLWPAGLSPFYNTPYVSGLDFKHLVLPAVGLVGSGVVLWVWARRIRQNKRSAPRPIRSQAFAFAIAWLVLPLLPLFNLSVLPKGDVAHDRYLYLPSVGFALMAALAFQALPSVAAVQWGAVTVLGALLTAGTILQSVIWSDDLLLYHRGLIVAPENSMATIDLANTLGERGMYQDAIRLLKQSLDRDPSFWWANYNLGYTYYRIDRLDEAEKYLLRAISIYPNKPSEFLYLGLTELKKGRLQAAEAALRQAIKLRPDLAGNHFALGMVLKLEGNLSAALEEFQAELAISPDEPAAKQQIEEIRARQR